MILDPLTTTELIELIMAIEKLKMWHKVLVHELKRRERLEESRPVKVDPFEECLETLKTSCGLTLDERHAAKAGWDAAIKHTKENL